MASTYIRISDGVKKGFEQDMVTALTQLGQRAMLDAYAQHTFTHRTRNLHDSYASAVYLNGKLIESSVKYLRGSIGFKRDHNTKKTGRQTVDEYLHSHKFGAANNEIVLVVIAAMYYAGILEAGDKGAASRGPGDKYIVISPARKYIDSHWQEVTAKVYAKYGIKEKPKARVIKGERLQSNE